MVVVVEEFGMEEEFGLEEEGARATEERRRLVTQYTKDDRPKEPSGP